MDSVVKSCIDGRRMVFSSAYELTDVYQKKVDELFKRIEDFGKDCTDAMDFETKFASSPLNKEYTDLFTYITNDKYEVKYPMEVFVVSVLNNFYGNEFFDDIAYSCSGDKEITMEVITTQGDFDDFMSMLEYYNEGGKVKITAKLIAELPDMEKTDATNIDFIIFEAILFIILLCLCF